MSTFSRVYKPYTFRGKGRGVCENQHIFRTLIPFWPDFYYFHGDFWNSKMLICTLFGGRWVGKVVSESVWFVDLWKCWHLWMAPKYLEILTLCKGLLLIWMAISGIFASDWYLPINMNSHLGTFRLSLLILKYWLILQRSPLRLFSSSSGQSGLDAKSISVSSAYIFFSQDCDRWEIIKQEQK